MPVEMVMIKTPSGMIPATTHDADEMAKLKVGQPFKVVITNVKQRSLQHHKLFFGGLLELAYDAWQPTGGLLSPAEKHTMKAFCDWMDGKGFDSQYVRQAGRVFLEELTQRRASKIETPHKSKQAILDWLKIEAGHFELQATPGGIRKVPKSINFNAMDQRRFMEFYRAAFSVCWRFILSRNFSTEEELQNAVDQLSSMS